MKRELRLIGGRKLESPIGQIVRPTTSLVREAVMNIINQNINNSNWLDLYSGTGIIGCEAIERGAKTVVAIEINKKVYKTCLSNLSTISNASLQEVSIKVINCEVNRFLKLGYKEYMKNPSYRVNSKHNRFDFIYIDPPYKLKPYYSVLENLLIGDWVLKESLAICEFSLEVGISIPPNWMIKNQKNYGNTGLLFLTPNQA